MQQRQPAPSSSEPLKGSIGCHSYVVGHDILTQTSEHLDQVEQVKALTTMVSGRESKSRSGRSACSAEAAVPLFQRVDGSGDSPVVDPAGSFNGHFWRSRNRSSEGSCSGRLHFASNYS